MPPPPHDNIIDLDPKNVDSRAVLIMAQRAARHAEQAEQRALAAFDITRALRTEMKKHGVELKEVRADVADMQAVILVGLHDMAQTEAAQTSLEKSIQEAKFNAKAARDDAKDAADKSEEITGRYDLAELARQSNVDRQIVQRVAITSLSGEEKNQKLTEAERAAANRRKAQLWRIGMTVIKAVATAAIAVLSALLATYGIHSK